LQTDDKTRQKRERTSKHWAKTMNKDSRTGTDGRLTNEVLGQGICWDGRERSGHR